MASSHRQFRGSSEEFPTASKELLRSSKTHAAWGGSIENLCVVCLWLIIKHQFPPL